MNVLYISYDGALDPLGHSQIIPYLAGLSKNGISFTLLTYEKREKLNDLNKVARLSEYLRSNNIRWERLVYHKSPTLPATLYDIFRGTLRGIRIILKNDIDLIHARSFVGAMPALFLTKIFKCKLLYDNRGFYPEERVDGNIWKNNSLLYKAAKLCERICQENADWIVCLTGKAQNIIRALPYLKRKDRVTVIPTCSDTDRFTVTPKNNQILKRLNLEDRFTFVYSGSIGTWYMLDEMLDFFKIAKQLHPKSFFLLLTSWVDLVKRKAKEKAIDPKDMHVEFVEYDNIPDWLSVADAGIFFIRPSYSKKSSCPTKFAEILACGLPVIINSGVGDTDTYVLKYDLGVVVKRFSDEEYRSAFKKIKEAVKSDGNRDYRYRCRKAAEDFFSLKSGIENYKNIYEKLNHS